MFIFCTDIDGTIYLDDRDAELFRDCWQDVGEGAGEGLLIFNTGRSVADCLDLLEKTPLPRPRYIIGGVGTEIYDLEKGEMVTEWAERLERGWQVDRVRETVRRVAEGVVEQPEECQNPRKVSWFWHDKLVEEIEVVEKALEEAGLEAQIVYSTDRDLDVIPRLANKGNALRWLVDYLGRSMEEVIVAGDSGNDLSLFQLEEVRGILPLNAEYLLKSQVLRPGVIEAPAACARGVTLELPKLTGKNVASSLESA